MPNQPAAGENTNLAKDLIRASWRRCADDYGFQQDFKHEVVMMDHSKLNEEREPLGDVLATSTAIIRRVRQIANDVSYVVLISNADGVIIEGYSDSPASEEISHSGLRKGSIWREGLVGTNGVGTAIASRQPLTVHGPAHYNLTFRSYTCSAAPIFSSDGKVVGALDLSGRATPDSTDEYRFAEYFVREAAQQMSMLLFRRQHQADCLVALSGEPDPMPMSCKALIAADENGKILGATPEAFAILGVPELSDLGNKSIDDLWRVSLEDLKPLSAHNVPVRTEDGETAYATAFLPKLKKSSASSKISKSAHISLSPPISTTQRPLDLLAGHDPELRNIVQLCRRIADKDLPILLLGDTGVGKDTLARAIHDESERRLRPYVAVNCAAIPATLLASELFGYTAGSFTGASRNGRVGKIQASDSGTLFLDEIGDMPLELQAHLLRVLEERTVTPLGSTELIPIDIKIICATHQDLPELVEQGKFRRDLYFRIKGAQITIPSLRDRTDIADLATAIFQEEAELAGHEPVTLSDEVIDVLEQYAWPGNIRELRSVARLVLSLYADQVIAIEHLPIDLVQQSRSDAAQLSTRWRTPHGILSDKGEPTTLCEANEAAEEHLLQETLRAHKWNVTHAAKQLGISRATLHRKIRKYGIVSPNNQD